MNSPDIEKTLKSFFSKRIKGAIRKTSIDINRGNIKIPEHKLNEIRKSTQKMKKWFQCFLTLYFLSIRCSSLKIKKTTMMYQIDLINQSHTIYHLMNVYIKGLMKQAFKSKTQYDVVRLSYGLDEDKMSAKDK